jgi:hypothetical protein
MIIRHRENNTIYIALLREQHNILLLVLDILPQKSYTNSMVHPVPETE